jgi:hypothetical protein
LGSASGWSEAHGTLGATGSGLNGANGQLVAAVPRLAFPRAPLVLFAMTMHVRSAGHILALTGSGHLVPTIRSPGTANLTASGAATLTMHSHRSGVLALQISVQSN